MRTNQLGSSEYEDHFLHDQNDTEVPVHRTSGFDNRFETIQAIQELQMEHSRRSNGNSTLNLQEVHKMDTLQ